MSHDGDWYSAQAAVIAAESMRGYRTPGVGLRKELVRVVADHFSHQPACKRAQGGGAELNQLACRHCRLGIVLPTGWKGDFTQSLFEVTLGHLIDHALDEP